jgi:RNA polymerase sigma-70 factor (ECF subfamily)
LERPASTYIHGEHEADLAKILAHFPSAAPVSLPPDRFRPAIWRPLQENVRVKRVSLCIVKPPRPSRPDEWALIRQRISTRFPRPHSEEWSEFGRRYWRPIYEVARRSGLSPNEAEQVVMELLTMAAPHLLNLQGAAGRGLRHWVRETTKWLIQHRHSADDPDRLKFLDLRHVEKAWEEEWQSGLLQIALAEVKQKVSPQLYQVYELWILRRWPLLKVRTSLGMNLPQMMVAGYRVKRLVHRELKRLQEPPQV